MILNRGDRLVTVQGTPWDHLGDMMSGDYVLKADGTVECEHPVAKQVERCTHDAIADELTEGKSLWVPAVAPCIGKSRPEFPEPSARPLRVCMSASWLTVNGSGSGVKTLSPAGDRCWHS